MTHPNTQYKLKELYCSQNKIPRLLEIDEDRFDQPWDRFYIQLGLSKKHKDAEKAKLEEIITIDVNQSFDKFDDKEARKVLLLGVGGAGKTTLLHYICHAWANGRLWADKFDFVYRVPLKILLNKSWSKDYGSQKSLECLIHRSLFLQTKEIKFEVSEILESMKGRTLFLLDGYNEMSHFAWHDDSRVEYNEIMTRIFDCRYIIMSSRYNAINSADLDKFDRSLEIKGLDIEHVTEYVYNYFSNTNEEQEKLGLDLQRFLERNIRVRGMCEIPINMVIICIIWNDHETRENLNVMKEFNVGLLYRELIVWLGKRWLEKFEKKQAVNLAHSNVLDSSVMIFLREIAYASFVRDGNYVKNDIIKKHLSDLYLPDVYLLGLLKSEHNKIKIIDTDCQFIHPTIQEYLAAHRIMEMINAEPLKICTSIGQHRNEFKYLSVLKFLAGMTVDKSTGSTELICKFWECVQCNVDGIIELGIETKIALMMHLIEQSKFEGKPDTRIPNLHIMIDLIEEFACKDFINWKNEIIGSGYVSEKLVVRLTSSLKSKNVVLRRIAVDIIAYLSNKGELEQSAIFERFVGLLSLENWQLTKFVLENLTRIFNRNCSIDLLKDNLENIVSIMLNENLTDGVISFVLKIIRMHNSFSLILIHEINGSINDSRHLRIAIKLIIEMVKSNLHKHTVIDFHEDIYSIIEKLFSMMMHKEFPTNVQIMNDLFFLYKALLDKQAFEILDIISDKLIHMMKDKHFLPFLVSKTLLTIVIMVGPLPNYLDKFDSLHDGLNSILSREEKFSFLENSLIVCCSQMVNEISNGRSTKAIDWIDLFIRNLNSDEFSQKGEKEIVSKLLALLVLLSSGDAIGVYQRYDIFGLLERKELLNEKFSEHVLECFCLELNNGRFDIKMLEIFNRSRTYHFIQNDIIIICHVLISTKDSSQVFALLQEFFYYTEFKVPLKKAVLRGIIETIDEMEIREFMNKLAQDQSTEDVLKLEAFKFLGKLTNKSVYIFEGFECAKRRLQKILKPDNKLKDFQIFSMSSDNFKYLMNSFINIETSFKPESNVLNLLLNLLHNSQINLSNGKNIITSFTIDFIVDTFKKDDDKHSFIAEIFSTLLSKFSLKNFAINSDNFFRILRLVITDNSTDLLIILNALRETFELACNKNIDVKSDLIDDLFESFLTAFDETKVCNIHILTMNEISIILGNSSASYKSKNVQSLVNDLGHHSISLSCKFNQISEYLQANKRPHSNVSIVIIKTVLSALQHNKIDRDMKINAFRFLGLLCDSMTEEESQSTYNFMIKELCDKSGEVPKSVLDSALRCMNEFLKRHNCLERVLDTASMMSKNGVRCFTSDLSKFIKLVEKEQIVIKSYNLVKKVMLDHDSDDSDDSDGNDGRLKKITLNNGVSLLKKLLLRISTPNMVMDALDTIERSKDFHNVKELVEIFRLVSFNKLISYLNHNYPKMRKAAVINAIERMKDERIRLEPQNIIDILQIINSNANTDKSDENLSRSAEECLNRSVDTVGDKKIFEFMDYFTELTASIEAKTFLKKLYRIVLKRVSNARIDERSRDFIIRCIEHGFTTSIKRYRPEDDSKFTYELIFDDTICSISEEDVREVERIVEAALKQDNILAKQYRDYQPLFKNSGSGLEISAMDLIAPSLLSNKDIDPFQWKMSKLCLSDHREYLPRNIFVLLERRDMFGYHVIHKISFVHGQFDMAIDVLHPNQITLVTRKSIFGNMKYEKEIKPRYFYATKIITRQTGDELIEKGAEFSSIDDIISLKCSPTTFWASFKARDDVKIIKIGTVLKLNEEQMDQARKDSLLVDASQTVISHGEQLSQFQGSICELRNRIDRSEKILQSDKFKMMQIVSAIERMGLDIPEMNEKINSINNDIAKMILADEITMGCLMDLEVSMEKNFPEA